MNVRRSVFRLQTLAIQKLIYVSSSLYMRTYVRHLIKGGMHINGFPNYIGDHVYFDGTDYGLITLNDNVTISREVMFLTHDASIHTVAKGLEFESKDLYDRARGAVFRVGGITIGKNSFVGARASILPGTRIGENVIVGAGAVVKGNIPDNVVVVGNPCRVLCSTSELVDRHLRHGDLVLK